MGVTNRRRRKERIKTTLRIEFVQSAQTPAITPAAAKLMQEYGIAVEDIPAAEKITVREVQTFIHHQKSADNEKDV